MSYGRVVGNKAGEDLHLLLTVEHGVVHVDIDDGSTAFNLLAGNGQRLVVFLFGNESGKLPRTSHIGTLADVDEVLALAVDE